MEKVETWNEIYKTHPVRKNLTDFLPFGEQDYVLYSAEKGNPLVMEDLLAQREEKGCNYIVIACDNKYALKMFAGSADETQHFFSGMEADEQNRRTYSRAELENMMKRAGIVEYRFFYPYPNYQLPLAVYSDSYQPKMGELTNNLRNFGVDRAVLFDESKAWDQVVKDGLFTTFTNSFLLVIGPEIKWENGEVIFSKFSNDRAPRYNIRTDIIEESGKRKVLKSPIGQEASSHIASLQKWYEALSEAYPGVQFNRCVKKENLVELEYLTGTTLDEVLIGLLQQKEQERFMDMVKTYVHTVLHSENPNLLDVDMIFKNILVTEDGSWTVLDYEWTFDKEHPDDREQAGMDFVQELTPEFVIYRSMYYFAQDNQLSAEIQNQLFSLINLTEEKKKEFDELEQKFQAYVSQGHRSLGQLYGQYRGELFYFNDYIKQMEDETKIELYALRDGKCIKTISESHLVPVGDLREIRLYTEETWDEIEVVLGHCDMIADILEITLDGQDILEGYTTNGKWFYRNLHLYIHQQGEPKIFIKLPQTQGKLQMKFMIKQQGDGKSAAFATLYHYLSLKERESTPVGKIKKMIKRGQK